MQKMARKDAKDLYSNGVQASITKVAKSSLLKNFQKGFETLKGDLKINTYVAIEHLLMEMPKTR